MRSLTSKKEKGIYDIATNTIFSREKAN